MESRIILPGTIVQYLEACSGDTSLEIRAAASAQVEKATPEELWTMVQGSFKGLNFSSRPLGNDQQIYLQLIALPPAFSREVLERYQKNGFLEERDIQEAYQATVTH